MKPFELLENLLVKVGQNLFDHLSRNFLRPFQSNAYLREFFEIGSFLASLSLFSSFSMQLKVYANLLMIGYQPRTSGARVDHSATTASPSKGSLFLCDLV